MLTNFSNILSELQSLHDKKNLDYGTDHDPYQNVRGSQDWGVAPWKGAMVRLNDKIKRLQKYARDGRLANEGAEDSFKDIAVYAIIALDLWRQEQLKLQPVSDWQRGGATQNDMESAVVAAYGKNSGRFATDPGDESRARND